MGGSNVSRRRLRRSLLQEYMKIPGGGDFSPNGFSLHVPSSFLGLLQLNHIYECQQNNRMEVT
jgi:hypothetical protein